MRHLRVDYDAIQPWPTKRPHIVKDPIAGPVEVEATSIDERALEPIIPDDEPVFLLRAKDVVAPDVVHAWANAAAAVGSDPDLVNRVHEFAEEMRTYARDHYKAGTWKAPDVPHGLLR